MRTKVIIIDPSQTLRGILKDYIFSRSLFLEVIEVGFRDNVIEILNQEAESIILIILGVFDNSEITSKDVIEYVQNHDFLYFVPIIIRLNYHYSENKGFYGLDLLESIKSNSNNFGVLKDFFTDDDFHQALKVARERRLVKKS